MYILSLFVLHFSGSDTSSSEPSQAETADFCASPQGFYNLPSIQFITVPDTTGYQVVQTLSLPSTVIRFPLPNAAATPTYVLGELDGAMSF